MVLIAKEPATSNKNYENFLTKNKERTNFKEKFGAIKTNHKIIQNNRENPFLVPVLTNLPSNNENKNNIKEDLTSNKQTHSSNFYELISEFDSPKSISYQTDDSPSKSQFFCDISFIKDSSYLIKIYL